MIYYLPNLLTILRLFLVVPVAYSLLNNQFITGVIFFVVASLTDLVDGWLARVVGTSRLGSILDPLADKLLLVTSLLCLWHLDKIAWPVVVVVLLGDLLMLIGAMVYHQVVGAYRFQPTRLGKWNTALQFIFIAICMLGLVLQLPWLNAIVAILSWVVVGLVIVTSVDYIIKACQRHWEPIAHDV